jgi:serine protease
MMSYKEQKMKTTWFGWGAGVVLALLLVAVPLFTVDSAGDARVWVQYAPGKQAAVGAELTRVGAQFHHQFGELEAYVVSVPQKSLAALNRNPNIINIEEDPVRELVYNMPSDITSNHETPQSEQVVPYGVDMVQARDIWDANRNGKIDPNAPTGAGRTVCIIDTGLFTEHEEMDGVDIIGGLSQTNPDPDMWTYDGHGHGTHVAGTVTAMHNEIGVVGVTPGTVSLFIVKIFDDQGQWVSKAHASDLVRAANECETNGANVISMSLSGTHKSRYEERAFDNLYSNGVLSVAAASNDGIEVYHYPASYDSVISVAALDENYVVADFSQHNDQVELAAPGVNVLSTVPYIASAYVNVDGQSYQANHIEYAAYGSANGELVDGGRCLTIGAWTGAVVLCERGDISFYEKVMNVQNGGGVVAVIYNNTPENFWGTLGEGNSSEILAISLSQADGQYLVNNKLDSMAEVSSLFTPQASGYEAWDGTSMSTPHVSAVAALIWSWNPMLTNVEIREALQQTAMDLGEPGKDDYYGYGLVQAYDAWLNLGGGNPGKP